MSVELGIIRCALEDAIRKLEFLNQSDPSNEFAVSTSISDFNNSFKLDKESAMEGIESCITAIEEDVLIRTRKLYQSQNKLRTMAAIAPDEAKNSIRLQLIRINAIRLLNKLFDELHGSQTVDNFKNEVQALQAQRVATTELRSQLSHFLSNADILKGHVRQLAQEIHDCKSLIQSSAPDVETKYEPTSILPSLQSSEQPDISTQREILEEITRANAQHAETGHQAKARHRAWVTEQCAKIKIVEDRISNLTIASSEGRNNSA
jgi:hypothetical protein